MSRSRNARRERRNINKAVRKIEKQERANRRFKENQPDQGRPKENVYSFRAKTSGQVEYITSIVSNRVTVCRGLAGTGKTMIAAALSARMLIEQRIEKIYLVRPIVEASATPGKSTLGYLPGSKDEKVAPYLRPLVYEMSKFFSEADFKKLRSGEFPTIEILPLEHLRGMTLSNCVAILDEAQNATYEQLKMFLSRMGGNNSTFIVNGDSSQADIHKDLQGGLDKLVDKLQGLSGVGIVDLQPSDIVRDPFLKTLMRRL